MTMEQIREMERQTDMLLKKVSISKHALPRRAWTYLLLIEPVMPWWISWGVASSQTLKKPGKAGSKHEGNKKTLKDEIVAVGSCT